MTGKQTALNKSLTILSAYKTIREQLVNISDSAGLDAYVILSHICQKDKSWLLAHPEVELSQPQRQDLQIIVGKLKAGTPLPYLLGKWEFFGLEFLVTPDVLIPRPETELLVETALEWLGRHPEINRVVEAGTGSGCIAVSLAVNLPWLKITAVDVSPDALRIAQRNADLHQVAGQITYKENDLLDDVSGSYDLICANLPYIPTNTLEQLKVYQREPTLALDGGKDGLDLIRRLLHQAQDLLASPGLILLEIEERQGEQVLTLAQEIFPNALSSVRTDLAGRPRLLVIEYEG